MNALVSPPPPAFPPDPAVGQIYLNWVWNGSSWVCRAATGAPVQIVKVFTASGTYWPSPGLTTALVECVGGGGGGGGAQSTFTGTVWRFALGGGGGGAGGYCRKTLDAALLAAGVQVAIGAGGAGVPALTGGAGGDTSFGAFCVARGGGGGLNNTVSGNDSAGVYSGTWGAGGRGGGSLLAQTGDFTCPGNSGDTGQSTLHQETAGITDNFLSIIDGKGGAGPFGGSPWTSLGIGGGTQAGQPAAANTGAGGGGAVVFSVMGAEGANGPPMPGGAGGSGVVIVTEWCFGNTSLVQDCGCGQTPTPCPPPADPCLPCVQNWWGPSW